MERFYKRKAPEPDSGNNARNSHLDDINWEEEIKSDLGLRNQIDDYHPNVKERVRRKYLENGPCQPRTVRFRVRIDDYHPNDICKLEMEDKYNDPKKRRHKSRITNKHYYQVDCFNDVIDWLLQELDSCFNETSTQCLFAQQLLVQETHSMILV